MTGGDFYLTRLKIIATIRSNNQNKLTFPSKYKYSAKL